MMSVSKSVGGMYSDCNEYTNTVTVMQCNFYVNLFSKYIPQSDLSVGDFCDMLVGLEVPLKDSFEHE